MGFEEVQSFDISSSITADDILIFPGIGAGGYKTASDLVDYSILREIYEEIGIR